MRTGTMLTITAGALLAASEPSWLDLSRKGMQSLRDGRYAQAEAQFRSAAALADQTEHGNECLAQLRSNLGSARYLAGNLPGSAASFRDAISHWHLLPEADPIEHGKAHANLAVLLRTDANYAAAESEGREATGCSRAHPSARPRRPPHSATWPRSRECKALVRSGQGNLGGILDIKAALLMIEGNLWDSRHRPELAEPFYRSATAYQTKLVGRRHPRTLAALNNLAQSVEAQGRLAESGPLLKEVLDGFEAVLGPAHPQTDVAANHLAQHPRREGQYAEAEQLYRKALPIWENAFGPSHPHAAKGLENLVGLFALQGKVRGAESLYRRALAITDRPGTNDPLTQAALQSLAALHRKSNRRTEFERLKRRLEGPATLAAR